MTKRRIDAGQSRALSPEQINLLLAAKRENHKRSAQTLLSILQLKGMTANVHIRTVQRVLKQQNMGGKWKLKRPPVLLPMDIQDPMDVWMGDFSPGVYLPHPHKPGKMAQTHLCLWFDAGGSIAVSGQYYWEANQFNGMCTLKDGMLRFGIPIKTYVDNGELAGEQVKRVCAYLGVIFCTGRPYHKEGRANVERMFQTIQNAFESELRAYPIKTLEDLNHRFHAWLDLFWNKRIIDGKTAISRFNDAKGQVQKLKSDDLSLFLFEEKRVVRKNCLVYVQNIKFWVDPPLIGKEVMVRYNPNDLHYIEIFRNGKKYQTAYPFDPNNFAYKLCRHISLREPKEEKCEEKVCDFLGELAEKYPKEAHLDSGGDMFIETIEHVLKRPLDSLQKGIATKFFNDSGPFDLEQIQQSLQAICKNKGRGLHIHYYLEAIDKLPRGNGGNIND